MKKILIIDDDSALRDVMKTVLSSRYELREAGSKAEGLALLKTFMPDLVMLDVMMESANAGFEAAREIKSDKKFKNVKILMITNVDRETSIDFKSEAGDKAWLPVDDYIVKPLDPKTLISKVQKLI
jgi:two-component system phosphate regulon response regulator PhoB